MSGDGAAPGGERILVTGAGGFIGGRLVQRLVGERGARVRAALPDLARAARIARFPVELAAADVTDPDALREAAAGCDVIVHCAYGSRGTAAERRRVTVEGTRNVLEAARWAGARRVVHVSTLMVYGLTADGVLQETAPRRRTGDPYGDDKLDAERLVLDGRRESSPAVCVVQPTAVYGPFAPSWTVRVLEQLRSGIVPLIDGGEGICNVVYIDDVVDALLLAIERREAAGEAFLISGQAVTYCEFYGRFAEMLGGRRTVSLTLEEAMERRRASGEGAGEGAAAPEAPVHVPDPLWIRFQALNTVVSTEKARRLLGYEPRTDLETGMRRTELWARWAGLLPAQGRGASA